MYDFGRVLEGCSVFFVVLSRCSLGIEGYRTPCWEALGLDFLGLWGFRLGAVTNLAWPQPYPVLSESTFQAKEGRLFAKKPLGIDFAAKGHAFKGSL